MTRLNGQGDWQLGRTYVGKFLPQPALSLGLLWKFWAEVKALKIASWHSQWLRY